MKGLVKTFKGWKLLEAPSRPLEAPGRPLEAPGGPWRPLEAPGGPWRPLEAWQSLSENPALCRSWRPLRLLGSWLEAPPAAGPSFSWKEQEDDLFEVGIEGVALNPNRK